MLNAGGVVVSYMLREHTDLPISVRLKWVAAAECLLALVHCRTTHLAFLLPLLILLKQLPLQLDL